MCPRLGKLDPRVEHDWFFEHWAKSAFQDAGVLRGWRQQIKVRSALSEDLDVLLTGVIPKGYQSTPEMICLAGNYYLHEQLPHLNDLLLALIRCLPPITPREYQRILLGVDGPVSEEACRLLVGLGELTRESIFYIRKALLPFALPKLREQFSDETILSLVQSTSYPVLKEGGVSFNNGKLLIRLLKHDSEDYDMMRALVADTEITDRLMGFAKQSACGMVLFESERARFGPAMQRTLATASDSANWIEMLTLADVPLLNDRALALASRSKICHYRIVAAIKEEERRRSL